jgi:toxin ParE1/3/4
MAEYYLSQKADDDLTLCFRYGVERFGLDSAVQYLHALLGDNPNVGRDASELAPRMPLFRQASHVIFYQSDSTGVLIARVLRKEMGFKQHV